MSSVEPLVHSKDSMFFDPFHILTNILPGKSSSAIQMGRAYGDSMKIGNQDTIGYFLKGFGQDLQGELFITVSSNMGPTGNTGKILQ